MVTVLGVDAGQSGTRLRLVRDGAALYNWLAPASPSGEHPGQTLRAMFPSIRAELASHGLPAPDILSAGMTGFHSVPAGAHAVLADFQPLGTTQTILATDAVTSYLGALGMTPGVVVAAGTGTTVLATDLAGRCVRVDGWGATLGDDGSGYAVGRAGLRAAYRAIDGRGGSERLRDAACAYFGSLVDLPLRLANAEHRVREVAGFARCVAQTAAQGDRAALEICRTAGEELADSVAAAAAQIFGVPAGDYPCAVSWSGSLFAAEGALLKSFQSRLLTHGLPPAQAPRQSSVEGAVLLATEGTTACFPAMTDVAVQSR